MAKKNRNQHLNIRRIFSVTAILVMVLFSGCVEGTSDKKELIFQDDFSGDLSNWIIETGESEDAKVSIENEKMVIDVDRGATVWLDKKLSGNIQIEYDRRVVMEDGKNDRLSDLNQFWMARDPENSDFFTRDGNFNEYDSLQLYYFGIGGNTNSTTRFRKYLGNGKKPLIHDFQDEAHLLQPNKSYHIQTVVYNGVTKVFVDGKEYFSYEDKEPFTEGYFGFRTTQSRHEIDELKIYRLK